MVEVRLLAKLLPKTSQEQRRKRCQARGPRLRLWRHCEALVGHTTDNDNQSSRPAASVMANWRNVTSSLTPTRKRYCLFLHTLDSDFFLTQSDYSVQA